MKLTQVLLKQHLERMARRHWYNQGKKAVSPTSAEKHLKENGFEIVDGVETFIKPKHEKVVLDPKLLLVQHFPRDHTHPEYKAEPCYIFGDGNALLAGVKQTQVLTNTVLASEPLPSHILKLEEECVIPDECHEKLKNIILLSCVFDAEQKKLPIKKDSLRPAWNFPRDYGITDVRKNTLLCMNLAALCDQNSKNDDLSRVMNVQFSYLTRAHGKQLQFGLSAEVLFTSQQKLASPSPSEKTEPLAVIHPLDCTVSIAEQHFYEFRDAYPLPSSARWPFAHTALLHFNPTQVANIYGTEVTADQRASRLMMKAFTIAASQAVALQQGEASNPITVQVVQTDGQHFQFGVLQLNTLDLETTSKGSNVFWLAPSLPLYSQCAYSNGRPVLEGYNPSVLRRLLAFLSTR